MAAVENDAPGLTARSVAGCDEPPLGEGGKGALEALHEVFTNRQIGHIHARAPSVGGVRGAC